MKYHHGNLRSELIRCACTLCEEHGHDKISLRGIAKEANVSQTAPYRHFETKESLLAAVAAYGFVEMKKSHLMGKKALSYPLVMYQTRM